MIGQYYPHPKIIKGLVHVIKIITYNYRSIVLTADGSIFAFGYFQFTSIPQKIHQYVNIIDIFWDFYRFNMLTTNNELYSNNFKNCGK